MCEDKLKEEFKKLKNAPPSQNSSHAVSVAGTTPPASANIDAEMDDPFAALASDGDNGAGVNFKENEDASKNRSSDA